MQRHKVLVLGGTGDARALASLLARDPRFETISSLAGRTREPLMPEGLVRVGGFGGVGGLATYLRDEAIDLVCDATHPFAARISANAAAASQRCGVPYVRLERPGWKTGPGDDWRITASVAEAALALAPGARALVTVGRQELGPFAARTDVAILARMIEPPDAPPPPHLRILVARPPFAFEQERALIADERITVLVTKNSGGEGTRAKLDAARDAGLPIIMVARPAKPAAPTAARPEDLHDLIVKTLGL